MHTDEKKHGWETITGSVIGCAYKVANSLGAGFLEKVYENALAHELRKSGLHMTQQHAIEVEYDGVVVGEYAADLLVEDIVLIELKCCRATDEVHMAQCMHYLKATWRPVCLLINFGTSRIQVKRILNPANPEGWVHPNDDFEDDDSH